MDLQKIAGNIGKGLYSTYLYDDKNKQAFPNSPVVKIANAQKLPEGDQRNKAMNDAVMNIAVALSAGKTPNIHPEDQSKMMAFIDNTRLKGQPFNHQLELDASRIAEHYKLPMPKSKAGLANAFDRALTILRQQK